jgi:hypothetical protein
MKVKWIRGLGASAALVVACLAAAQLAQARSAEAPASPAAPTSQGCSLAATGSPVKHVIYLQFDNVHYRRDAAGVPSDLEQMPHLLHFLRDNGTLLTNDHTVLISHTAGGILSSLTGTYPDRNGQTVTNSYGFFKSDGSVGFSSAFKYWTDPVDATPYPLPSGPPADPLPNMITDGQKTAPAPWVPFTRAGCDVGGVGTANIELENTSTNATGDMTHVFGTGSPEWNEASAAAALPATPANAKAKGQPQTDFVGIAVHCGKSTTSVCAANQNARPDPLPNEPGGYNGYQALFGAKYVDPAITANQPCVPDTTGQPITDASGTCGFPGFDGMLARNTLGYVAQMQEHGVPVTYGYISDAHDAHTPNPANDSYASTANGPGEAAHDAQLKAYDDAFQAFFQDLAAHGIDKSNTLFAITVDEGDHFAGGTGVPQPDGTLQYAHTVCTTLTACPSNQIGEVNANIAALLPAGEPPFLVHSDDAPTFYVNGHPSATDPAVRKLERDVSTLQASDPYVGGGQSVPLMVNMADPAEEQALHMVNADPNRTPTFTMFGNPDYFFTTSDPSPCPGVHLCVVPGFAWNHGDVQEEIGNTWAGLVGPGVAQHGVDAQTWTDHTNLRPTILALTGLADDYAHDGRVLVEALNASAIPAGMRSPLVSGLARVYEQLNAPFGAFGQETLTASTHALASGSATDDSRYARIEARIQQLTATRDTLARQIAGDLDAAAFANRPVPPIQAIIETAQADILIATARALALSTA